MISGVQRDLIFDIGVNHGEDTELYLAKGFRVVGVEADPILIAELANVFEKPINDGRFMLEPVGIMERPGSRPFYRNITCDHWSSFVKEYGTRDNTEFEIIEIPCVTIGDLIKKYGCPYYMKIDIEGVDESILSSLLTSDLRPNFISVEEFGARTLGSLQRLGYQMFSLRPQLDKTWAAQLETTREGRWIKRDFTQRDSGLFGLDVPDWMPFDDAKLAYHRIVRNEANDWLPTNDEWFDIHATLTPEVVEDIQKSTPEIIDDLIFDIGMYTGDDTDFYLKKGFRVVGVEANPDLTDLLATRFAEPIKNRSLTLLSIGLLDKAGTFPFYVNKTDGQWSSFLSQYGARSRSKFQIKTVPCKTLPDLIKKYGCPHYLKLNCEGTDSLILAGLEYFDCRPPFVSIGDFNEKNINYLIALGYNYFRLTAQNDKSWAIVREPSREGVFIERTFTSQDSGPFGRELSDWISASDIVAHYAEALSISQNADEWFDIHATYWPRALDREDQVIELGLPS